jgi:hypothetical protein
VPNGEEPDCTEEASSPHAIKTAQESEPDAAAAKTASPHAINTAETKPAQQGKRSAEAKPAKRVKSKRARSRPLPSFLRKVDLFLSQRR